MNLLLRVWQSFWSVLVPTRFQSAPVAPSADSLATQAGANAGMAVQGAGGNGEEKKAEPGAKKPGELPALEERPSRFFAILRWALHFLLVILILVVLYYLNAILGLERFLRSDWPWLHQFWLPLLFLIIYVLCWLGGWLWYLTRSPAANSEHNDITIAWNAINETLIRSGIDMREVPVFLVLGQPIGAPEYLFGDPKLRFTLSAPRGSSHPIRVYANRDAILLTCFEASVLAKQTQRLVAHETDRFDEVQEEQLLPQSEDLLDKQDANAALSSPNPAQSSIAEEQSQLTALLAEPVRGVEKSHFDSVCNNRNDLAYYSSRLRYVCELLSEIRSPRCPINGILVTFPYAALQAESISTEFTTACRSDLLVVHQTTQLVCPVFTLVTDMQASDGFREMVRRIASLDRVATVGQHFPLYPDLDSRDIPKMLADGTSWLVHRTLPTAIFHLADVSDANTNDFGTTKTIPTKQLLGNNLLYDLLGDMMQKEQQLARFLVRGTVQDIPETYYSGGVFFAATGQDCHAFIHGVLDQLLSSQSYVSWSPEAFGKDRSYQRWNSAIMVQNLLLLIAVPILIYFFWPW